MVGASPPKSAAPSDRRGLCTNRGPFSVQGCWDKRPSLHCSKMKLSIFCQQIVIWTKGRGRTSLLINTGPSPSQDTACRILNNTKTTAEFSYWICNKLEGQEGYPIKCPRLNNVASVDRCTNLTSHVSFCIALNTFLVYMHFLAAPAVYVVQAAHRGSWILHLSTSSYKNTKA
jgi:hypothetical protein